MLPMAQRVVSVVVVCIHLAAAVTPIKEAELIVGGIVEGFIGAGDVKACIQKTEAELHGLEEAVKDFEKKDASDIMHGLTELAATLEGLPDAMRKCKAAESDVAGIVKAFAQLSKPASFAFHVAKDLVVNGHDIYTEIFTAVSDYKSQRWEEFGVQVGTALHKLLVGVDATVALSATPVKEAELIVGGIVEGFIGAGDVKACIQKTEAELHGLEDAVKDFEKKDASDIMHGLKELAATLEGLPDAMRKCKAAESDIAGIVKAFAQLSKPASFAFHVAKDLVVNGHDIYTEIFTAVSDYKSQKWEEFGVQVGTALHKLLVGVDATVALSATPVKEAELIVGGVIEGFIGASDIKACIQKTEVEFRGLEEAVKDFEKKDASDIMRGLKELAGTLEGLPDAMRKCKAAESDIVAIVKAFAQLSKPASFAFHVAKDLVVNGHDIYTEIFTAVSDYKSQKWEDLGVQVGTALHKLLVGVETQIALSARVTPIKEAELIVGGVIEGFVGVGDVKACIQKTEVELHGLEEAVKDFEKKDASNIMRGLKELADTFEGLPDAMRKCKAAESDVAAIVKAFAQLSKPASFAFHVAKDLVVNGHDIYTEISAAVSDYKSKKLEDFGVQVGTALHKLLVGAHFSEGATVIV